MLRNANAPAAVLACALAAMAGQSGCSGSERPGVAESRPGSSGDEMGEAGSESETGGEGGTDFGPLTLSCESAGALGLGRVRTSLRGANEQVGGACGLGGPELFFSVEMPERADLFIDMQGAAFTPRLERLNGDCLEELGFACASGPTFAAYDQSAGTVLRFALGIDPESEALSAPLVPGEVDPLSVELRLSMRSVLGLGEVCSGTPAAASARCGGALVCEADGLCSELPGNACANATTLDLPALGQSRTVEVDADANWGDVHAHSCGGERLREQVFRVPRSQLGALAGGELEISYAGAAAAPIVAMRGGGCLVAAEAACASLAQALRVPVDALRAKGPGDGYLFVELEDGQTGPIPLEIAVVDP